jgi:hypothetical protein
MFMRRQSRKVGLVGRQRCTALGFNDERCRIDANKAQTPICVKDPS